MHSPFKYCLLLYIPVILPCVLQGKKDVGNLLFVRGDNVIFSGDTSSPFSLSCGLCYVDW